MPHAGVEGIRRIRVPGEIDRANLRATVQHLLPLGTAIFRAVNAALRIRPIGVPKSSDEHGVRVFRMHQNAANVFRIAQADIAPGLACIERLVDAIAHADIGADVGLAGAHVKDGMV